MVYGECVKNCFYFPLLFAVSLLESSSELIVLDRCYKQWPCLVDFFFLSHRTHSTQRAALESKQITLHSSWIYHVSTMLPTDRRKSSTRLANKPRNDLFWLKMILQNWTTVFGRDFLSTFSNVEWDSSVHDLLWVKAICLSKKMKYQSFTSRVEIRSESKLNRTNDFCLQS